MSFFRFFFARQFSAIFWTQFFGAFNDNVLKNALVILITFEGMKAFGVGSELMVVAAGGIFIFPFFLFSGVAGQMADKYPKTKIVFWVKLSEIFIMIGASLGFYFKHLEWLFICLFSMGLHSAFFGPVKYSIIPQLMPEKDLLRANGLFSAGTFVAILLGTLVGGLVITSENREFWTSLCLLTLAVGGLFASFFIPAIKASAPELKVRYNPFSTTWDVLKMVLPKKSVFFAILGTSWFWFFGASILSLLPLYVKNVLGGSESVVTFFLACFSIGVGIGSVFVNKISKGRLELGLVPLGALLMFIFLFSLGHLNTQAPIVEGAKLGLFDLWQDSGAKVIIFCYLSLSIVSGFFIVPLMTLLQEKSDETYRSRIIGAGNILNSLFMVIASVLLMVLFKLHFSLLQIFIFLSFLHAAFSIFLFKSLMPEFLLRFYSWLWIRSSKIKKDHATTLVINDKFSPQGAYCLIVENKTWKDFLFVYKNLKDHPEILIYIEGHKTRWLEKFLFWQIKAKKIKERKDALAENFNLPIFLTQSDRHEIDPF